MIVYSEANANLPVPHMTFEVIDNTVEIPEESGEQYAPAFNFLIPIYSDRGPVNTLKLFRPGDLKLFTQLFGKPDASKNGFAMDFVADILDNLDLNTDAGVYVINLRGTDATAPNAIINMKYKVEENVQKTNADGEPLYTDATTGLETTTATDNEPIVNDVLHVKFELDHEENCLKWIDILAVLNKIDTETPDADGFKTYPFFGVVNPCNSEYGNNAYLRILPSVSVYDNRTYYAIEMFDGDTTVTTDAEVSFHPDSGEAYIEQIFLNSLQQMKFVSSPFVSNICELLTKYLPSGGMYYTDVFKPGLKTDTFVVEDDSIDFTSAKAISFAGGTNGTGSKDELLVKFFNNEIVTDVKSTIRYHFHCIPDVGYTGYDSSGETDPKTNVIAAIEQFCKDRIMTTTALINVGSEATFASAINEHLRYHTDDMMNIYQIARCQSPLMINPYTNRAMIYPPTYFITMALVDRLNRYGNLYDPMGGANFRISGYIDDTMNYAPENADLLTQLENSRVNVVMKDASPGGYLSNQLMCTQKISDRTEMNNAFLISDMIYDLITLIHQNTFTFNEASQVTAFSTLVDEQINGKYSKYTASMSIEVYRKGTTGRASKTKIIKININLRDIAKYANTYITLEA